MRLVEGVLVSTMIAGAAGTVSMLVSFQHALSQPTVSLQAAMMLALTAPLTLTGLVIGGVLLATLVSWSVWIGRTTSPPRTHHDQV